MDQRQGAKRGAALERGEHLVVLDHQRALVGHEVLEGVDPALDHLLHLVEDPLVPAGDRHVIRDVGADLRGRLAVPLVERADQRAVGARQHEINQHGGAAGGRRKGARLEGLGRGGAHERHLQMGVRVDAAGDDIGIRGVNGFVALQVLADPGDLLALDQDVGLPGAIGGDDGAALDDFGHGSSLPIITNVPGLTRDLEPRCTTGRGPGSRPGHR